MCLCLCLCVRMCKVFQENVWNEEYSNCTVATPESIDMAVTVHQSPDQ